MILCISEWGTLAPIARRMWRDGADVRLFLPTQFIREQGYYQGLCPQVRTLEEGLRMQPECILFDNTDSPELAQALAMHTPVWGASPLADQLEHDRGAAMELMSVHGIRIPKTLVFDPHNGKQTLVAGDEPFQSIRGGVQQAIGMAKELDGKWVIKPYHGEASETYVAKGVDDLVSKLKEMAEQSRRQPFHAPTVYQGRGSIDRVVVAVRRTRSWVCQWDDGNEEVLPR